MYQIAVKSGRCLINTDVVEFIGGAQERPKFGAKFVNVQLRSAEAISVSFASCFTFRFWPHLARGQLVRDGHCIGNNHILEFQMY